MVKVVEDTDKIYLGEVVNSKNNRANNYSFMLSYLLGVEDSMLEEFYPNQYESLCETGVLSCSKVFEVTRQLNITLNEILYSLTINSNSKSNNPLIEITGIVDVEVRKALAYAGVNPVKAEKIASLLELRGLFNQLMCSGYEDILEDLKSIGFKGSLDVFKILKYKLKNNEFGLDQVAKMPLQKNRIIKNSIYGVLLTDQLKIEALTTDLTTDSDNILLTDKNVEALYNKLYGEEVELEEVTILEGTIDFDGEFDEEKIKSLHSKYRVTPKDLSTTGYKKRQTRKKEELDKEKREEIQRKKEERTAEKLKLKKETAERANKIREERELRKQAEKEEQEQKEAERFEKERKRLEEQEEKRRIELERIENEHKEKHEEKKRIQEEKRKQDELEEKIKNAERVNKQMAEQEKDNQSETEEENETTMGISVTDTENNKDNNKITYHKLEENDIITMGIHGNHNKDLLGVLKTKETELNALDLYKNNKLGSRILGEGTVVFVDADNIGVRKVINTIAELSNEGIKDVEFRIYVDQININIWEYLKVLINDEYKINIIKVERVSFLKSNVDTVLTADLLEEHYKNKYAPGVECKNLAIMSNDSDYFGIVQKNIDLTLILHHSSVSESYLKRLKEYKTTKVQVIPSDDVVSENKYIIRAYYTVLTIVLSRTPMIYWSKDKIMDYSNGNLKSRAYGDIFISKKARELFSEYIERNMNDIMSSLKVEYDVEKCKINLKGVVREYTPLT